MSATATSSIDVLLVDDEPDFAQLVADQLGTSGGEDELRVTVETDAEAAVERVREEAFDCVVSDYEMPGKDGLELLETVRTHDEELPFILFTGQGSESIASEAISAGVTEYMQKATDPRQFDVLENRVRNAVEKYRAERELERTETRYRRLVEQNITGIYIIQDADIVYANPKCAEIFGYSQEELLGMTAFDVVAEEDHDVLQENIRKREEGDVEELNYTLTGVRKSGERFEFEVHSGRIDHEGEPAILGSLVDVTEQRERERQLEEYRELVETVGDPMYVLDDDGRVEKVNAAMADLLGYDREELLGSPASRFVDEEGLERGGELVRSFIDGSADPPRTIEVEFVTAEGDHVPVEANLTILRGEDGEFRGSVGVVRVIAERKERERELEEYETIVETAPDGVFIIDEDGVIVSGNQPGASMVGYDREELVGEHYATLVEDGIVEESFAERYVRTVDELLEQDTGQRKAKLETTLHRPDGTDLTTEIHISPLVGDDGGFRGTVGILRDITERKSIENALRTERDRLSALFENIPEPTIDYEFRDGEPIVLQANDAFEETFGYDEAEVVGESVDDYVIPSAGFSEAQDLNERVVAGEQLDVEIERLTADGDQRDFLLRNAPIPTEDDTVQGYAIYTDITDRRERERRLSALHEASRRLMDATSESEVLDIGLDAAESVLGLDVAAFYSTDDEAERLEPLAATRGARDLFDDVPTIADHDAIAWQVFESGDPVVADDVRDHEQVYNPDAPARSEMVLPVGDHGVFMAASETVGAFDDSDATLAKVLVSNVEAAIDRAARESLLRDRERRLSALHRATRRLMEATSRDQVIDIGLRAAETVLGLDVAAVYGEEDDRLVPLAATDGAQRLFGEMPSFDREEGILWQVHRSGDPIVTEDFRRDGVIYDPTTPVRSEMVLPVGDHGVFMAASETVGAFDEADETLAKVLVSNVEAALDRAERESLLRQREQALLRQNERLEEFAGVVSHDLRSPITVAKGNVYLLREKGGEEYVDKIEDALERMEELIDDLLTLARQGEAVDERERVELLRVAEDAWKSVDTAAASLAAEKTTISADPTRFQQLLENLFGNAVEHGGRSVDVRVGVEGDTLYVEDDGAGIDADEQKNLFEAGFSTDEEGTGFGLSIVEQIAAAHGWEVSVTESDEGGARFEFHGVELPEIQRAD